MVGALAIPGGDVSIAGSDINDKVILGVNVHLGCSIEVSSFEVVIDRGNPLTDPLLDPGEASVLANGDAVTIEFGRAANKPLLITGILEEIEYVDEVEEFAFRNIVVCRGRCDGYQLFARKFDGDLIALVASAALNYTRTSGDGSALVAYLIDNYTSLTHTRVNSVLTGNANSGQKVVAVTDGTKFVADDLVKIYDDNAWEYNKVASVASNNVTMVSNLIATYTTAANAACALDLIKTTSTAYTKMDYINTTIFEIIRFIAETADLAGVIGYDFRVEYDSEFSFFQLGAYTESYNLQDEMQFNRYVKSAERIKNKITVFGKDDKPYPLDVDGREYSDAITETFSQNLLPVTTSDAALKLIKVAEGTSSAFAVDDYLWVIDNATIGELCQIDSIDLIGGFPDEINLKSNLSTTYYISKFAVVWEVSSDRGWGYIPQGATGDFNVGLDTGTYHTGVKSISIDFNNSLSYCHAFYVFNEGSEANMDEYPTLKGLVRTSDSGGYVHPEFVQIKLWSGDCGATDYAVASPIRINEVDQWTKFSILGGSKNAGLWTVGAGMDWTDIKIINVYFSYSVAASTYSVNIDRLHFVGKRWGGGTSHAVADGFAEDATSQSTYKIREHKIYSDLLLSDAECEAKAQSVLAFYKDERISIELSSDSLDWAAYHPMAGNKVAADLDMVGVTGSTYRIDSIDIFFRSGDNSLNATYVLGKTPPKIADYLTKIAEELRNVGARHYATAR